MNRAERIRNKIKAKRKRMAISKYPRYNPQVGWEKTKKDPDTGEQIGLGYLVYPRDSRSQRSVKKQSNRKIRRIKENSNIPNGNQYRKYHEYWWNIY